MNARAIVMVFAALLLLAGSAAPVQTGAEEREFQRIKLLVFDESWAEALTRIDAFLAESPSRAVAGQALYYRAKCLQALGGREREALRAYREFLRLDGRSRNLASDAETSIIDLALVLWAGGDRSFISEVETRLTHPDRDVRTYAAIQLSYVKDKGIAIQCVPVLKRILAEESSDELRDRAKIALLRVSPESLAEIEDRPASRRARMIHIRILDEESGRPVLSLSLPFVLADLVLAGMSEGDRALLRDRGYDVAKIVRDLQAPGAVLEIRDDKEGKSIKIWID